MFNIGKDGGSEYSEPIPFRTEKYLPVPNIRKDGGSEYSEGGSSHKSWCTRIMRGVNQHMEISICFVVLFFESFPNKLTEVCLFRIYYSNGGDMMQSLDTLLLEHQYLITVKLLLSSCKSECHHTGLIL